MHACCARDLTGVPMLQRVRKMLATATNTVLVGFTGTPLCDKPADFQSLLGIIKVRCHVTSMHVRSAEGST